MVEGEKLLTMYRDMVMARVFDSWMVKLQRMGRVAAYTSSEGQEAIAVGAAHALRPDDWIFPTYRETGAYIARRVPLEVLVARQLGSVLDPLKGHEVLLFGGRRFRIVTGPGPVAAHLCTSVGFALAAKYRGEDTVVLAFFGDGATSKGDFNEGLNMAGVTDAPVVFICQNNQYAISVPLSRQTASESIAVKAKAYGLDGVRIDGNDIQACYLTTLEAVEKARRGGGPTLIEAFTYRLAPHSTADDPSRYISREELEEWRKRDPLKRLKKELVSRGLWDEERDRQLYSDCDRLISSKIEEVEKAAPLPIQAILEDVYHTPPWHLKEELESLK
ncbi:2-oxoisovalerate dehydrogenase subunit alpha [archaeon HR01]|nr:2-oxoisovalerate dehydrogenase subunit alpha [archaeon HR01]